MKDREPEKRPDTRNGYLAVLPHGWTYEVHVRHSDGRSVTVKPSEQEDAYEIVSDAGDDVLRRVTEPTLRKALQTAVKGVKALEAVAEQEKAAKDARRKALAALGGDEGQGTLRMVPDEETESEGIPVPDSRG